MEHREFWVVNAEGYFFKVEDFNELSLKEINEFTDAGLEVFYKIEDLVEYLNEFNNTDHEVADIDGFEVQVESDLEGGWSVAIHGTIDMGITDIVEYIKDFYL